MKTNLDNAIAVAHHILEMAKYQDKEQIEELKKASSVDYEKTVGVSAMVFHSKTLLDLLENIKENGIQ